MEYNTNVDSITDETEQCEEEDSSFPEMVSPLNIFVWFGTLGWLLFSSFYLADMELSGLTGKIIWGIVLFAGLPISWAVVSFMYRSLPSEDTASEDDATEL